MPTASRRSRPTRYRASGKAAAKRPPIPQIGKKTVRKALRAIGDLAGFFQEFDAAFGRVTGRAVRS